MPLPAIPVIGGLLLRLLGPTVARVAGKVAVRQAGAALANPATRKAIVSGGSKLAQQAAAKYPTAAKVLQSRTGTAAKRIAKTILESPIKQGPPSAKGEAKDRIVKYFVKKAGKAALGKLREWNKPAESVQQPVKPGPIITPPPRPSVTPAPPPAPIVQWKGKGQFTGKPSYFASPLPSQPPPAKAKLPKAKVLQWPQQPPKAVQTSGGTTYDINVHPGQKPPPAPPAATPPPLPKPQPSLKQQAKTVAGKVASSAVSGLARHITGERKQRQADPAQTTSGKKPQPTMSSVRDSIRLLQQVAPQTLSEDYRSWQPPKKATTQQKQPGVSKPTQQQPSAPPDLSALLSSLASTTTAIKTLAAILAKQGHPAKFSGGGSVQGKVPGIGNEDSIHALLKPGEWVLRKDQVAKLGANKLRGMDKEPKRFAAGGSVGPIMFGQEGVSGSAKEVGRGIGRLNEDAGRLMETFQEMDTSLKRGGLVGLLANLPGIMQKFSREMVTASESLRRFDGSISRSFTKLEYGRMLRERDMAQNTSGSTSAMVNSANEMEASKARIEQTVKTVTNAFTIINNNILTAVFQLMEGVSKITGVEMVAKAIEKNTEKKHDSNGIWDQFMREAMKFKTPEERKREAKAAAKGKGVDA